MDIIMNQATTNATMLSVKAVFGRIASDYYFKHGSQTMNNDICHVLDLAIDCVSTLDTPSSAPGATNVCPDIWSYDQCLTSVEYNTTKAQICPHAQMHKNAISNDDYSIMHCKSTSGLWESLQNCSSSLGQSQVEAFTVPTDINRTNVPDYEAFDFELLDDSKAQLDALRKYEVIGTCITVGHALSLSSLTVAIILFFFLKRLHCTRIYIHMNLMITFILRGLVWLLHETAFEDSSSFENEIAEASIQLGVNIFQTQSNLSQLMRWKQEFCDPYDTSGKYIRCRVYFVMLNYTVTANYFWLLVEGLYLGLLLLRAMNPSSSNKTIMRSFLLLGWVFPWISVIGGIIARVVKPDKEDHSCWFENEVGVDWYIINIPILISLLINFIIFIMVVKVVGLKLKTNVRRSEETQEHYKWRLFKSTLALIPLLGIQYLTTVFFEFIRPENATLIFVEKAFELLFISIQGLMVAFIYCFMNGEIQDEVKRCWRAWKIECELKVSNQRRKQTFSHTSLTNLYTGFSRKPSAISTSSARRSDSVFTMGKGNGERSPRLSKQFFALSEIAEQAAAGESQLKRTSNSTETSSVLNSNEANASNLYGKEIRLSVPGWGNGTGRYSSTTDDDCFLNTNQATDNELFFSDPESQNLLPKCELQVPKKYTEYKTSII